MRTKPCVPPADLHHPVHPTLLLGSLRSAHHLDGSAYPIPRLNPCLLRLAHRTFWWILRVWYQAHIQNQGFR